MTMQSVGGIGGWVGDVEEGVVARERVLEEERK